MTDEAAEVAPGKAAMPEQPATDVRSRPTDATLELELVSSTDGAPITNGVVELIITPHTSAGIDATERIVQARTDPGGALRMPLAPCSLRIVAWSERASTRAFVELHEGETLFKRLVLIPTRAFRGCVVDALLGEPIPDAEVRIWTHSETDLVFTGPDGTFEHRRFPCTGKAQQVQVRAAGYGAAIRYLNIEKNGRWSALAALEGQPTARGEEDPWIEIVLVPERRLLGRVLDTQGLPIEDARVSAIGFVRVLPAVASREVAEGLTDENGTFELTGLRSDISHTLTIAAESFAEQSLQLADEEALEHDVGDVLLQWEASLSGLVHDASGYVVEDALVRIVPVMDKKKSHTGTRNRLDVAFPFPEGERVARTDAAGVFTFASLPTRSYRVSVERDDGPLVSTVVAQEMLAQEALTLRIPPECLVLEGEVRDGDKPVVDAIVRIRRFGHVASTRTGRDGRFRVSGLDDRAPYDIHAEWQTADGRRKYAENRVLAFEKALLIPRRNTESELARSGVR
ncbi:MAG: hypothetical protein CMJ89_08780 [Planctomycetes bacterium]|nr:hypothetical protein [Planctomycetota bacterium]